MREQDIHKALTGLSIWDSASPQCQDGFIINVSKILSPPNKLGEAFAWYNVGWQEALDIIEQMIVGV